MSWFSESFLGGAKRRVERAQAGVESTKLVMARHDIDEAQRELDIMAPRVTERAKESLFARGLGSSGESSIGTTLMGDVQRDIQNRQRKLGDASYLLNQETGLFKAQRRAANVNRTLGQIGSILSVVGFVGGTALGGPALGMALSGVGSGLAGGSGGFGFTGPGAYGTVGQNVGGLFSSGLFGR